MSAKSGKILLVDDQPQNLGVLFDFLSGQDYQVLVSPSGTHALQLLERDTPDLILLDVMMPELDGFETCRRIRSNPYTREIPIIFMTALSETVDEVHGLEIGAVDYITKPFKVEIVLARIHTHLQLQRLRREQLLNEKWRAMGNSMMQIGHELFNPLGAAQMALTNLRLFAKQELSPKSFRFIDTCESGIRRAADLLHELKREFWSVTETSELLSLAQLVGEALEAERDQFPENTERQLELNSETPASFLPKQQILDLMRELFRNAAQALQETTNPQLEVQLRAEAGQQQLTITDNGPGIAPENLDRVFEPFFTTHGPQRKGLGLYRVYGVINALQGEIQAQSKPGHTTFRVTLPLRLQPT